MWACRGVFSLRVMIYRTAVRIKFKKRLFGKFFKEFFSNFGKYNLQLVGKKCILVIVSPSLASAFDALVKDGFCG